MLSKPHYDRLKWFIVIFLPALAVLTAGLGELYQWHTTNQIVGTINLITVFLGSLLQLSHHHYHQQKGGPHS